MYNRSQILYMCNQIYKHPTCISLPNSTAQNNLYTCTLFTASSINNFP